MYESRDQAFSDWLRLTSRENITTGERDVLKHAFFAGWKARKDAQYASILELGRVVER